MTTDIAIGVAGIVFGFVTSYVFYIFQKRRRELCWSIDSVNLIEGNSSLFEKLDIQYGGQKIENLTVSKIVLWNNGNETIDGKDIAIPPIILPRDEANTKILDAKIIKASTIGNGFEIHQKPDNEFLAMQFDYLDPQQGAVIQVIHTGVSLLPLMIHGEVKGVKKIQFKSKRLDFGSQIPRLFTYFYAITLIGFLVLFAYQSISTKIPFTSDWTIWLLLFLLPFLVIFVVLDVRQVRDTAKIPRELSVFEKDDIGIKRKK